MNMGFTKDIIKSEGIPQKYRDNAKKCLMCGENVVHGGTWAGVNDVHLSTICNKQSCIEEHIKWLIDSFISDETKDIRHLDTKQEFMNLVEKVYIDKSNHPNHNK